MNKLSNQLTGTSGEYFAAAELSRRGYIASISLRNAKGVDILVSSEETNDALNIQVKTTKNVKPVWMLSEKNEHIKSDKFLYIFVMLPADLSHPAFYIVPSKIVARYIKKFHKIFLSTPGNKDSSMRKFRDLEHKYLDRWNLLDIPVKA